MPKDNPGAYKKSPFPRNPKQKSMSNSGGGNPFENRMGGMTHNGDYMHGQGGKMKKGGSSHN